MPEVFREKLPSRSVTAMFLVPNSCTVAPIIGSPDESLTFPIIVCADKLPTTRVNSVSNATRKFFKLPDINVTIKLFK